MRRKVRTAIECLGKGFDVNADFRLKYCRGHERLVVLDDEKAELAVPGFGVFEGVSVDIKCEKGDRVRHQSDFLNFKQMSELLNRKSSISGRFPSGMFNYAFGFSGGSWSQDAKTTRTLAFDGCFITLFELRINRRSLSLSDDVIAAVPSSWDPISLAGFRRLSISSTTTAYLKMDPLLFQPKRESPCHGRKEEAMHLLRAIPNGCSQSPPRPTRSTSRSRPSPPYSLTFQGKASCPMPLVSTSVISLRLKTLNTSSASNPTIYGLRC